MAWGDTAKGRRNIAAITMMVPVALVPDGSIDEDDREQVMYLPVVFTYGGTIPPVVTRRRFTNGLSLMIGCAL